MAVVCLIALVPDYKLRQPDPYAYRASIAALLDGHLLLDRAQYDELNERLSNTPDGWDSRLGIIQWTTTPSGDHVSEKNPGYPFLAAPFAAAGILRLAPIFFLLVGCAGLWLAGRRWLGAWGGAFAVILFCSSATLITMTHEAYMPMATEAALVAGGAGLVLWALLDGRGARQAVVGGAIGFLLLGVAVTVRYTDILVLAVTVAAAALAIWRDWSSLRARWLALWAAAGALGPALALVYNTVVYGGPLETGYTQGVTFSFGALWGNLRTMPRPLLVGMPVAVLAAAGLVWAIVAAARHRRPASTSATSLVAAAATPAPHESGNRPLCGRHARRDLAVALFLLGWWLAVWLTYLAYDWTTVARFSMSYALTSRFYVSALGALALLGAYLLTRIPLRVGLPVAVAALCCGAAMSVYAVSGDWLYGHPDTPVVPQPGMPPPGAPMPGPGSLPDGLPSGPPPGMEPGMSPPPAGPQPGMSPPPATPDLNAGAPPGMSPGNSPSPWITSSGGS